MISGSGPLLRRINCVAVLRELHRADSMSFTELAGSTGLSRPTVEDVVMDLIDDGLAAPLVPASVSNRQAGRPAKRFAFRAEAGVVLGCDISVYRILTLATDLRGNELGRVEFAVGNDLPAADRIGAARRSIADCLSESGLQPSDVWALGISTTGIVDAGGTIIRSSRLSDWEGTNLPLAFSGLLPNATLAVGNDARCAALAEHWRGAATDITTSLTVLAGTTIAAAITIDGKPYLGRHGASGEIGGLPELGWPQAVDALTAITAHPGGHEPSSLRDMVISAKAGPGTRTAMAAFVDHFALGLITLVAVLDPQRVVIGGELAASGELLTGPLQARLNAACLFPVEVVTSALGDTASALGAVRLALDDVESWLLHHDRQRPAAPNNV
jgi:predicted NBD/HSP70 family sugar kinase